MKSRSEPAKATQQKGAHAIDQEIKTSHADKAGAFRERLRPAFQLFLKSTLKPARRAKLDDASVSRLKRSFHRREEFDSTVVKARKRKFYLPGALDVALGKGDGLARFDTKLLHPKGKSLLEIVFVLDHEKRTRAHRANRF